MFGKKHKNPDATEIYGQYEKGINYHSGNNFYNKTAQAHRMFIGDQWYGLESGGEEMPIFNIIQPTVEYKVSMVSSNGMSINYSSMNFDGDRKAMQGICEMLNKKAAQTWELLKMDKYIWQIIKDACIGGDAYVYFYFAGQEMKVHVIDNTSIYLSNEQESNLQKQEYIIIAERRLVSEIREEAKANGISADEIDLILPDDDTQYVLGEEAKREVKSTAKCLSLLKMWKENGTVHFCRSTKNVIYQKDTAITGLTVYPIANYIWISKKGSARGVGEVIPMIPNQIEINRNLARRLVNSRLTAYSRLVYNRHAISNPKALEEVGTAIEVDDSVQGIKDIITYLEPSPMGADARQLQEELINMTRELAGAGDAATGSVNPENASGAAIIAVRDQAAIPLNEQIADYKQFVEDIAMIWYNMWLAYNPNGLEVAYEDENGEIVAQKIAVDRLEELKINIRIDVSQNNPFSRFAQEQSLEKLFMNGDLNFEEYVEALDDNSSVPKAKLQDILNKRKLLVAEQPLQSGLMNGGGANGEMPAMPAETALAGSQGAAEGFGMY